MAPLFYFSSMNYTEYQSYSIGQALENGVYGEEYAQYIKLNNSRSSRVSKTLEIRPDLNALIGGISVRYDWHIITEPWCGDAAQSVPVIANLALLNPIMRLHIHLRDIETEWIEQYLTEGSKSIPIVVVREPCSGEDLFVWGPRPKPAQTLMKSLKTDPTQTKASISEALQRWYIQDKASTIQSEIFQLLRSV